jgi:hypothetical protein
VEFDHFKSQAGLPSFVMSVIGQDGEQVQIAGGISFDKRQK